MLANLIEKLKHIKEKVMSMYGYGKKKVPAKKKKKKTSAKKKK